MNPILPLPDPIPAPAWIFHILELVFFAAHILLMNIVIGGACLALYSKLTRRRPHPAFDDQFTSILPTVFAIAVNMGVAVLLFVQVLFGHLFYTSSILMATYWLLVVPALVLGYYAIYGYGKASARAVAAAAIGLALILFLAIGFAFVQNFTMMMHPDQWGAYFSTRNGTVLNPPDASLLPRYLHFVVASLAIGGLFTAAAWTIRKRRGREGSDEMIQRGLTVFGVATLVQIATGFWFLFSLKQEYMLQFMGKNPTATIALWLGLLCGIGAVAAALGRQFRATVIMISVALLAMVFVRDELRTMYLRGVFDTSSLAVTPQNGVLLIFVATLIVGLGVMAWMVKAGFRSSGRRTAP